MLGCRFPPWAPATAICLCSDFQFVPKPNPASPSLQQACAKLCSLVAAPIPTGHLSRKPPKQLPSTQHTPSFVYILTRLLKVCTPGTLVPTNTCAPSTQRPTLCQANSTCWLAAIVLHFGGSWRLLIGLTASLVFSLSIWCLEAPEVIDHLPKTIFQLG